MATLPPPQSTNTDIVAVYDQNYNQVFKNARSLKAVVKEEAKSMEHPLENGSMIVDHRVILPVEIELSLITQKESAQDLYKVIRQYYLNSSLLIVHTRSGVYENQYITSMPHEESPDQIDVLIIALKLKQAQFATTQTSTIVTPKNPSNTTTLNRGTLQPQPLSQSAALQGATAIFGRI